MRISDWSSDVCSSDLLRIGAGDASDHGFGFVELQQQRTEDIPVTIDHALTIPPQIAAPLQPLVQEFDHLRHQRRINAIMHFKAVRVGNAQCGQPVLNVIRSEEHTSELQSLMRISYAVFCLKKTTQQQTN